MKNSCEYDEKQIMDRGKVFEISFFISIFTLIGTYFLQDWIKMSTHCMVMICFWIPATSCTIMLILKDAYEGMNVSSGRFIPTMWLVLAVIMILMTIVEVFDGGMILVKNGELTDEVGGLIATAGMSLNGVVYYCKHYYNKRKTME